MDKIVFYSSVLYIVLFFLLLLLPDEKTLRKYKKQMYFFFSLSLAFVGFYLNPPANWDSVRHFSLMDEIRNSNIGFFSFVFNNGGGIGGESLKYLVCFNIIRFILCNITDNNHWLAFVAGSTCYMISSYILLDYTTDTKYAKVIQLFSVILWFVEIPYMFIIAGIRCAMGVNIVALAMYRHNKKSISWFGYIIYLFVSTTIHPMALLIGALYIAFLFINKRILYLTALVLPAFILYVADYFRQSNNGFLSFIAHKFLEYNEISIHSSNVFFMYSNISVIVTVLIILFISSPYKKGLKKSNVMLNYTSKDIRSFIVFYLLFTLVFIGNEELLKRFSYLFMPLAPVIVGSIFLNDYWQTNGRKVIRVALSVPCLAFCAMSIAIQLYTFIIRLHFLDNYVYIV